MPGHAAPRYRSVQDYVRQRVVSGQWPAGHRIPSENVLVQRLRISRMTVNRALRELADEGLIQRVRGLGTFVADARPRMTFFAVRTIADEIAARGHRHHFKILMRRAEAAKAPIAAQLELERGARVFHVVAIHFENDVPVQLEDRFVSPREAPEFLTADLSTVTPSEYLLRHVPLSEIEHDIQSVLPDGATARRLDIDRSEPCLLVTRRTWLDGRAVTFVRLFHPGSRFRIGGRFNADARVR
ncbi:MAG: histidine utilization repressor [Alphaproteobacteria bacterium]|nr:histidine utilization repressor [Alphaproteobacteria bacterium]